MKGQNVCQNDEVYQIVKETPFGFMQHVEKSTVLRPCRDELKLVQKMFQGQFPEAVMKSSQTEIFGFFNEIIKNLDKELQDSLCMAWANYVHGKAMVILYDPEME